MITKTNDRVSNSLRARSQMRWYEHLWYLSIKQMWWQMKTAFKEALPFLHNVVVFPFMVIALIPYSFFAVHKARKEIEEYDSKQAK